MLVRTQVNVLGKLRCGIAQSSVAFEDVAPGHCRSRPRLKSCLQTGETDEFDSWRERNALVSAPDDPTQRTRSHKLVVEANERVAFSTLFFPPALEHVSKSRPLQRDRVSRLSTLQSESLSVLAHRQRSPRFDFDFTTKTARNTLCDSPACPKGRQTDPSCLYIRASRFYIEASPETVECRQEAESGCIRQSSLPVAQTTRT